MCLWVTFYQFSRILRKFLIKSSSPENLSNIQLNFFSGLKTVKGSFFFFLSMSELVTHLPSYVCISSEVLFPVI